jgi:alpha-amylase/alpha-mannosidase (GH57 family)
MNRKISLLFGVHAHQPAGNFEQVLNDAHARCYKLFIETVYRYPDFRLSVHFSGWLLGYLLKHFPEDVAKLREMVARGQVEMFGGGDTEPVLASIPERDRRSQLVALSDRLEAAFGQRPRGAWLTERVWESSVAPCLADSGIEYVTVDDYHFLCAGKNSAELTGYFTTEEGGAALDLFPISEALRYRFPFSPAPDAVRYVESLATGEGMVAAVYFDDIEKFGIWPETHEWVYGKKWLEQFIEGVLASPTIRMEHFRDYHARQRTHGVVYLPTTSYIEMNEWSLPPQQAHDWADLVAQEKAANRYESRKPFIRGGIWRNFISRYAESNWMHKRMLQVSGRVAALGRNAKPRMRELLHLTQSNDAYWHGLFGGIYLPHLRRSVWSAIVELEALLDKASPRRETALDLDLDGHDEIFLNSGKLQAVVRDDGLGAIHELDFYALHQNFGDTLVRRVEHYYRKIREGGQGGHSGDGIPSAHNRVNFKHPVSPEDLTPDAYPRAMFVDRIKDQPQPIHYALRKASANAVELTGPGLTKRISVKGNTLTVEYRRDGESAGFETEINLAMPSCDGFFGRYVVNGEIPGGFGQAFNWESIRSLTLEDGVLGGKVTISTTEPVSVGAAPHKTVSQSEDGFEKIMQAVYLRIHAPAGNFSVKLQITVEPLSG